MTGYRVYYNGGTDQGSRDVVAGDTTVIVSGLTLIGGTYSIRIVALSSQLPSPAAGVEMVSLGRYNSSERMHTW